MVADDSTLVLFILGAIAWFILCTEVLVTTFKDRAFSVVFGKLLGGSLFASLVAHWYYSFCTSCSIVWFILTTVGLGVVLWILSVSVVTVILMATPPYHTFGAQNYCTLRSASLLPPLMANAVPPPLPPMVNAPPLLLPPMVNAPPMVDAILLPNDYLDQRIHRLETDYQRLVVSLCGGEEIASKLTPDERMSHVEAVVLFPDNAMHFATLAVEQKAHTATHPSINAE